MELFKPSYFIRQGFPKERTMALARKINRKSNPLAERGFHFLLTENEVMKEFGIGKERQ